MCLVPHFFDYKELIQIVLKIIYFHTQILWSHEKESAFSNWKFYKIQLFLAKFTMNKNELKI